MNSAASAITTVRISAFGLRVARWSLVCFTQVAAAQQPQFDVTPPRDVWIKVPVEKESWPRHFRVGMLMGVNVKASFKTGGQFTVSGGRAGTPGVHGEDHIYDDGYVRVDDTGNALDRTSYWGYNDASQYDPVAQTLTFHSANTFNSSGSAKGEDSPYIGFDMAYGGQLGRWGPTRIGWELGFGLLPFSIEDKQSMTAQISRTVHSFSTEPIVPPTAPYNGGQSGIGPTIHDDATALPGGDLVTGTVAGSRTLEATLYSIRLGPLLHWELHPQWAVSLSAGPAAGFVEGDLKFDELIVSGNGATGRNTGRVGGSGFVFGGYVSAAVMFHAVEKGDFYLGVQYMPLGSMTINESGREARLDLAGGIYFSAGFNWPF